MTCIVGRLNLPAADTALLSVWSATGVDHQGRKVSGEDMARCLRLEGCDVSNTAVKDHRAGRCRCNREG